MWFHKHVLKYIAWVIVVAYMSVLTSSSLLAAEVQMTIQPQLFAQRSVPAATAEEDAIRQVYAEKIRRLEEEMNKTKGIRKNLLTLAITTFAVGTASTFAVNTVNDGVKDIPIQNPEIQPDESKPYEVRVNDCVSYVCYTREKQDALHSLDGIKGIGGGIFGVGLAGMVGYLLYTWNIRGKQQKIDTIRLEMESLYETRGLTPEYLQRNESVAAVMDEIESLKQQAGSARTRGELFSRLAIGGIACGAFLFSISKAMYDIVDDIDVDEDDSAQVTAKKDALNNAEELESLSYGLLGVGAASGILSFIFGRQAQGKENQIDDLEDSLLRVAERIEIQPKMDGFMIMYTHKF